MLHTRNFSVIEPLLIKQFPMVPILAFTAQCSPQGLIVPAYMQKTISYPKIGYSAVLLFPGYLGGFFQKNTQGNVNEMDTKHT